MKKTFEDTIEVGVGLVVFFVFFLWPGLNCTAEELSYSDREMIRNGGFENTSYSAWLQNSFSIVNNAALSGNNGLSFSGGTNQNSDGYFAQQIPIPSQLESATLSFCYRVVGNGRAEEPSPINFEVGLLSVKSDRFTQEESASVVICADTVSQMIAWQQVNIDLSPELIGQMQAAHAEGEFIYIVFTLETQEIAPNALDVHFDNISFTVNGSQTLPSLKGAIAFFQAASYSNPKQSVMTLHVLDPDKPSAAGDFNQSNAIYRYETTRTYFHAGFDVKWKPDGSQIAFISETVDEMYSPFYGDIYTVSPDGTDLKKIINPPFQTDIINGDFPRVTVSGTVINNGNPLDVYTPMLCLKGASDCIPIVFGEKFTLPNVAILDGNTESYTQVGVIHWFGEICSVGIEYEPFMNWPIMNGQVDLGTIAFDANMCIDLNTYGHTPHGLSWARDGSGIWTYLMASFQKFDPDVFITWPFSGESIPTPFAADNIQWSPVDDRYLYMDFNTTGNVWYRIFITSIGGQPQLLLEDVEKVAPAWLPDGSGFIFVRDIASGSPTIFHYDLTTGEIKRLTYFSHEYIQNVSVSPEGTHIVFEKCSGVKSCELWIMDRFNLASMWQIIEGGNYCNPDWSLTDVSITAPEDGQSSSGSDSDGQSSSGSGSGGGCFIEIVQPVGQTLLK